MGRGPVSHLTMDPRRNAMSNKAPTRRAVIQEPPDSRYGCDYLDDDIIVQVLDIQRVVRERLGWDHAGDASTLLRDPEVVKDFVSRAWDATTRKLCADGAEAGGSMDLVGMLTRLRYLERLVEGFAFDVASRGRRRTARALGVLARCEDYYELVRSIPEAVTSVGFDRAVFSTVADSRWTPRALHCRIQDSTGATGLRLAGDHTFAIPRAANRKHSAQVFADSMRSFSTTDGGLRMWEQSKSKSFWMVPIYEGTRLVGLIHADCYLQDRLASRVEVGALHALCEQLGRILASRRALDFYSDVAEEAGSEKVHSAHASSMYDNGDPLTAIAHDPVGDAEPSGDTGLSLREVDVVRLMAEGLTNNQIGRRLNITEGTVKSHVKRILRKTSSANRAEAVAVFIKSTRASG